MWDCLEVLSERRDIENEFRRPNIPQKPKKGRREKMRRGYFKEIIKEIEEKFPRTEKHKYLY